MSKRMRPSLKDYLRTGEVRLETAEVPELPEQEASALPPHEGAGKKSKKTTKNKEVPLKKKPLAASPKEAFQLAEDAAKEADYSQTLSPENKSVSLSSLFLDSLAPNDRQTWEPVLAAGVEIQNRALDFPLLREDFRTLDRNRFTCYTLEKRGEPLRPVRSSVQIKESLLLYVKWDEMGILSLYGSLD